MATNTVTTEQVREAIEQLAAMVAAASISPQTVADILEMMRNLNDQEREKVIAVANAKILEIQELNVEAEKVTYNDKSAAEAFDYLFGLLGSNVSYDSDILDDEGHYYDLHSASVGTALSSISKASSTSKSCGSIEVRSGAEITLHTYTTSGNAGYVRPYAIVSKSTGNIIKIAPTDTTQDLLTTPLVYNALEDVILLLACNNDNKSSFELEIVHSSQVASKQELSSSINQVNQSFEDLETRFDSLAGSETTYTSSIFSAKEGKYYSFSGLYIGSNAPSETLSSSQTKACAKMELPSGTSITLYSYTTSGDGGYVRPYCIVSKSTNKVIAIPNAGSPIDYTSTPFEYTANEDIILYLDVNIDHYNEFSLVTAVPSEFVKHEDISEIQEEIDNVTAEVQDLTGYETTSASELMGAATLGYYSFNGKSIGDTAPQTMTQTQQTYRYSKILPVKALSVIHLTTSVTTGNAGYVLGYALTDKDYKILKLAPSASGTTNIDVDLQIEEDGYLYVCCNEDLSSSFSYKMMSSFAGEIIKTCEDYADNKADNTYFAYLSRKVVLPHSPKILASGASFTSPENSWVEKMGTLLGATITNKAVAGTNIRDLALKLKSGTVSVVNMDAVVIMHVHNYDVFTLPEEYVNKTVAEYEASGEMDSWEGTGKITDDYGYAIGYDYVIKKLRALIFAQKSQDSYDQSTAASRNYMQGNYPQQTKIILATHWHDARIAFNSSVRKLCKKWCLPLINFDEQIGFSKDVLNEAGVQPSIEYVGLNSNDYSPYETIDGITYGLHPSLGNNDIQWRFAAIAADKFLVLSS